MAINDVYRITIDNNLQVYPAMDGIAYNDEYNDDLGYWTRVLDDSLTFINQKGSKAFDYLYTKELEPTVCKDVPILIEAWFFSQWNTVFNGRLQFNDATFHLELAQATLSVDPIDPLSCITDSWENEKNYLEVEDRVVITSLIGDVQCKVEESFSGAPDPPIGYGWTLTYYKVIKHYEDAQYIGDPLYIKHEATYCRETYDSGVPPGQGWILDSGVYYRPISVGSPITITRTETGNTQSQGRVVTVTTETDYPILDISIDNAVSFADLIKFYLPDCNIKSDFFNINPDNSHPDNEAYQYAAEYLHNMVVVPGTDVIISGEGEDNSTMHNIKFKELWEDLRLFFNLKLFYDLNSESVRIEHITYHEGSKILDLTTEKYLQYLEGTRGYEKQIEDFPRYEIFKNKWETRNPDFNSSKIEYDAVCTSGETQEYKLKTIGTDVSFLYKNAKIEDNDNFIETLVIIGLDENDFILNTPGILSQNSLLNGPLAWTTIVQNLHLYNRPLQFGIVNGTTTPFLSKMATKKQDEITIPMSKQDYFFNFNPGMGVRTQFGTGKVEAATFEDYGDGEMGKLTLEIIHE